MLNPLKTLDTFKNLLQNWDKTRLSVIYVKSFLPSISYYAFFYFMLDAFYLISYTFQNSFLKFQFLGLHYHFLVSFIS